MKNSNGLVLVVVGKRAKVCACGQSVFFVNLESNSIFASEAITEKGRVYKFDDASCMIKYIKSNDDIVYKSLYVNDYTTPHKMILVEKGFFLKGGTISAPMGGNIATFSNDEIRKVFHAKLKAQRLTWDEIYNSY